MLEKKQNISSIKICVTDLEVSEDQKLVATN